MTAYIRKILGGLLLILIAFVAITLSFTVVYLAYDLYQDDVQLQKEQRKIEMEQANRAKEKALLDSVNREMVKEWEKVKEIEITPTPRFNP